MSLAVGPTFSPGTLCGSIRAFTGENMVIQQSGTERQPIRFEVAPNANVAVTGEGLLTGWRKEPD